MKCVNMFQEKLVNFPPNRIDDFCEWIEEGRKKFHSIGFNVFQQIISVYVLLITVVISLHNKIIMVTVRYMQLVTVDQLVVKVAVNCHMMD